MENTNSPSKSYLQFGILFGIIMVLMFVITYVSGIDIMKNKALASTTSIFNYLILPPLFIYLGCNAFKKENNGYVSFIECLKIGVSIAFVAALILGVFNIAFNFIFPEFLEGIMNNTKQIMLEQEPNMTSAQVEMGVSMARKFSAWYISFPMTLVMFSFLGLIYSLIVGLIVKNDNPQF